MSLREPLAVVNEVHAGVLAENIEITSHEFSSARPSMTVSGYTMERHRAMHTQQLHRMESDVLLLSIPATGDEQPFAVSK